MTLEENASADKLPRGMSLEDMIETLKKLDSGELPARGVYASIIAALRRLERLEKAGQALSAAAQEVLDVDLYGGYERRLREAVKAWNAAVGEKE